MTGNGGAAPSRAAALARHGATWRLLGRFASMGLINTAVDFLVFGALTAAGVQLVPANAVSTTAGLVVSYFGNSRWVFRGGTGARTVVVFVVVTGIGLWIIQPVLIAVIQPVLEDRWNLEDLAAAMLAKIMAIVVAAVWNFLMYRYVVFTPRRHHERTQP